jgi:hypothetical protein
MRPIRRGFAPSLVNYKNGTLNMQPQVIKFTSCLPRVGGFLRVLFACIVFILEGRYLKTDCLTCFIYCDKLMSSPEGIVKHIVFF